MKKYYVGGIQYSKSDIKRSLEAKTCDAWVNLSCRVDFGICTGKPCKKTIRQEVSSDCFVNIERENHTIKYIAMNLADTDFDVNKNKITLKVLNQFIDDSREKSRLLSFFNNRVEIRYEKLRKYLEFLRKEF